MTRRTLISFAVTLAQPIPLVSEPANRNRVWNSMGEDILECNEQFSVVFEWLKAHEAERNPPLDAKVFEAINIWEARNDSVTRKLRLLRRAIRGEE